MDETLNEQIVPTNAAPDEQAPPVEAAPIEQAPPTSAPLGNEDVILDLPAQYSEGNAGFFNRQNESVPTALTVGPDGAIYATELTALPYPEGYARVLRVGDPDGVASFDGRTPGGTNQIYASGFDQLNGLTFDEDGALYALEYVNATDVYDPTLSPEDLPPSNLIRVDPDGTREVISGEELRFGNYVFAHEGKVYAAINNGAIDAGQVLAYDQDADGEWSYEVVADNLKNPRGMDIGPDGNLYVLESGEGTPADDPNVEDALSVQFIPGVVSQRAGYTAAITKLDLENGGQERIYEGLPSTIEYNPNTGEDRIISIGSNGLAIGEDGTAWIASGGGLSDATADALGEFGEGLRGVLKLEGLFGEDPSQATWTPAFDSVEYAGENGPDGATTLFNVQSNLNDIEIGPDGNLYAVDAARNVMYGISPDGENVESVSVLQKTPPVLTPPQYGLVTQAGGDPSADYRVEISERTFKGENELPDTPGRQQALENEAIASAEGGTDGELPSEAPEIAGEMPSEAPELPGEAPEIPGEAPELPSEAPEIPGEMPSEAPELPGEAPEMTGEAPEMTGEMPGEAPELPSEAPEIPGEMPELPGEAPEIPGEMTGEMPGQAPELPSEAPEMTGEMPELPGEAPEIPGEAPELPSEAPEIPGEMTGEMPSNEQPLGGENATIGSILGESQQPASNEDPVDVGQITADRPTPGNPMLEPQAPVDGLPVPEASAGEGIDLPDEAEVLVATTADSLPTEAAGFDPTMPPTEGDMDSEMLSSPPSEGLPTQEPASGNSEPPLRGEDATIGSILGESQQPASNEDPVDAGQITADRPTPGNPMLEPQAPADGLPAPEANTNGAPTEVPGFDPTMPPPEGFDPTMPPPEGFDPTMPPPEGFDAGDFDPLNPTLLPGVEQSVLIPGPVDPIAPVITEGNPFADYFDPFFGVYSPAEGEEPVLQNGEDSYTVDDLFVFGDRLTENGGEFGKNAVAESTGADLPYDEAPYSPDGNFTDGSNWTTYLGRILGVEEEAGQDTNFSYLDATARELDNPTDPFGEATELNTFAGQIDTFEQTYGTFTEDDLVVVNFGGNDLTLPPSEGVAPEEAAQQSIQATVDGIASLQELGAENFLVGLVPPVELAPIFSDPEFQAILGVEPGFFGPVVEGYNEGLTAALEAYEVESGANIELLDVNSLFDSIAAEPGAYGFVNVDEPVLSSQTPLTGEEPVYNEAIVGEDPAVQHATLFIDPFFHPTALGHSIVAETARDELLNLGEDLAPPTPEATEATVGINDMGEDPLMPPSENGMQTEASELTGNDLTISVSVPEAYFEQIQSVFSDLSNNQVIQIENVDALFSDNGGEYFEGGIGLEGESNIAFELYPQDESSGETFGGVDVDFSIA